MWTRVGASRASVHLSPGRDRGLAARPPSFLHAAAKAGIYGLMRSIAVDYARHGIRANAVAPGAVATPLLLNGRLKDADMRAAALRAIPMNRFAEPIELAQAILFLASSEASYITGQILVVDGGATIP